MNEETLSALLDGECSPAELDLLLRQMNQDPAMRQRFARMALGQEVRRGIRVPDLPADFADTVMAALPERPDPVAASSGAATVVPLARRRPWQPLTGLAAAAAVGAVAVLAIKPELAPTATGPAVPVAQAELQPGTELSDREARQLRSYLMAYSQSRAQQGMGGTLGYARYAAYTGDDVDGDR